MTEALSLGSSLQQTQDECDKAVKKLEEQIEDAELLDMARTVN